MTTSRYDPCFLYRELGTAGLGMETVLDWTETGILGHARELLNWNRANQSNEGSFIRRFFSFLFFYFFSPF